MRPARRRAPLRVQAVRHPRQIRQFKWHRVSFRIRSHPCRALANSPRFRTVICSSQRAGRRYTSFPTPRARGPRMRRRHSLRCRTRRPKASLCRSMASRFTPRLSTACTKFPITPAIKVSRLHLPSKLRRSALVQSRREPTATFTSRVRWWPRRQPSTSVSAPRAIHVSRWIRLERVSKR